MAVTLEWHDLIRVPCWTPLCHVVARAEPLAENLFRIGPCQYLVALPSNERFEVTPDAPFVTIGLWAPTDGAARRAFLLEIEADERADALPPAELLPHGQPVTYGEILCRMRDGHDETVIESATYRVATDGVFVHRNIRSRATIFHFRKRRGTHDPCYAIEYRLPGGPGTLRHGSQGASAPSRPIHRTV